MINLIVVFEAHRWVWKFLKADISQASIRKPKQSIGSTVNFLSYGNRLSL